MNILETALLASDLEPIKRFYKDTLGLSVATETEERVSFQAGASWLTFERSADVANPYYHFAFNVSTSRMETAIEWLEAKGVAVRFVRGSRIVHSESWNSDSVYFGDPAGNVVELIARHSLPGGSSEPFHPGHVLGISEIGLPADDVPALSAYLKDVTGVDVYRREDDSFAPLGDEEGLFILSSVGRTWLGSEQPSIVFPLRVSLRQEGRRDLPRLLHYPYSLDFR